MHRARSCSAILFCTISIMCLIIGVPILWGGYLPNKLWNEKARETTCSMFGTVEKQTCNFIGGNGYTCFQAWLNIKVDTAIQCSVRHNAGIFPTSQAAWNWLNQITLPPYHCYYVDQCYGRRTLKDTHDILIAGIVFTGCGILFLIVSILLATLPWCMKRIDSIFNECCQHIRKSRYRIHTDSPDQLETDKLLIN